MIGGSGEKKTLRTVAKYADMWNAMGTLEVMAHKVDVLRGHCDAVGRDIGEIEFTLGVKVTIRDSEAEADRVWKAAMAHNRTPLARRRERRHVLERHRRADRRPAATVRRPRLPDRDLASSRRRTTSRRSSGSSARSCRCWPTARAGAARICRQLGDRLQDRPRLGRGREPRRVADRGVVEGVADELIDRTRRRRSRARAASAAGRRRAGACRWRRSRRPRRSRPTRRRTRRRARSRRARARGRACRGRSGAPRAGRRRARSRGRRWPRVPIAWPSAWTSPTPVPLACPTPGQVRGQRASASAPRGPSRRRRRRGSHVADRPDDAERHRLGERVRVAPTGATRANGSSRRCRSRPSRPAAGRRSGPDRGSSPRAAATDGRCSPCGRPPRR